MLPSPPQTGKATIKFLKDNSSIYSKKLTITSIKVEANRVNSIRKEMKESLLSIPRFPTIIKCPNDQKMRWIYLKEGITLTEQVKKNVLEEKEEDIIIGFDSLSMYDILRNLLPSEIEIPTSFEGIGHIAHLNLRSEHEPYKYLIGHVLILKNRPKISIVVNKIGSINNVYRFFEMEVIARSSLQDGAEVVGDELVVEHQEDGVRLSLDYSKVYWNSKLQYEHSRLVELFVKDGQRVCDMFCGIGPFVLQCLNRRKDLVIWANDLNPESIKWLKYNLKNQKGGHTVMVSNTDARSLLPMILEDGIIDNVAPCSSKDNSIDTVVVSNNSKKYKHYDHYILNLPASATEFLDIFSNIKEGMVHCYLFASSTSQETLICKDGIKQCSLEESMEPIMMVQNGFGRKIDNDTCIVRRIRNVSPRKEMYCVSFPLSTKKGKPEN